MRSQLEEERCPNCGGAVPERFCTRCGQERLPHRQTVLVLLKEFVEGVFSFDSLVVRSLIPLLFRPGFLTQEYMAGRRQRYISPLRIYLTVSVLFFAVGLIAPASAPSQASPAQAGGEAQVADRNTGRTLVPSAKTASKRHEAARAAPANSVVRPRVTLHGTLTLTKAELPTSEAAYEAEQTQLPPFQRDGVWTHFLTIKAIRRERMPQGEYNARVIGNLQKAMFIILPIFALLLQALYFRTHPLFLEHLVFTLHIQSFTYTLLSLQQLLQAPSLIITRMIILITMVYQFEAVRRVYKQWLPTTILKFLALNIAWAFVQSFLMMALAYLTVFQL